MDDSVSLQDQFAPDLICFGCGPANEKGLRIKSFVRGDKVYCEFEPSEHHQSFPGMMNGGIIGSLLDCHMNWTAAWRLMQVNATEVPPCTVTAEYSVVFKAPTPSNVKLELEAWVVESNERKAVIEATLAAVGEVTAVGTGTFVAVKEGHPAYHRW
jgi:acyl-coenzyme A thioesterase PaaI-like protein